MDSGFIISNGMAFSPDDKTLIFGDSTGEVIYRYDFDAETGTIANRRDFLRTEGVPWHSRMDISRSSSAASRSMV